MTSRLAAALCTVLACAGLAGARSELVAEEQAWAAVTALGRFQRSDGERGRWRYWLEGQVREGEGQESFRAGILRPGLGWDLTHATSAWAGYAYVVVDPVGPRESIEEHRLWQQIFWVAPTKHAGLLLSSRTRLEQRFLEGGDDVGWRFRQFGRAALPLGANERWSAILFDELFVHLNDTDWGAEQGFDQNRAFLGLGYQIAPQARLELGYLNQYVALPAAADRMNHVALLALFLTL